MYQQIEPPDWLHWSSSTIVRPQQLEIFVKFLNKTEVMFYLIDRLVGNLEGLLSVSVFIVAGSGLHYSPTNNGQ